MSCLRMFFSIFCSVAISAAYSASSIPSNIASNASCMAGQARRELGAAFVGQEHMADAAVGDALLAPHEALALQRVERAAQGRLLDDGIDREIVDGDAVGDRQHGQRAHLRNGQALLAHTSRKVAL